MPAARHLTAWPAADLAQLRDETLEEAMADLRRAVELGRTLRSQAGIKTRQPLGRLWLAMPAGSLDDEVADELLGQLADELNVQEVEVIGDESDLMLDCWMAFDVEYTVRLAERLRPYRLKWMEECLLSEDYDAHLAGLFDHFHRNPELSTVEFKTAARMADPMSRRWR